MFGSMKCGVNVYVNIGVEIGVIVVSLYKLIIMFFDGVLVVIVLGKKFMGEGNIKDKGEFIIKVILIIDNGLCVSLNK